LRFGDNIARGYQRPLDPSNGDEMDAPKIGCNRRLGSQLRAK
jgi:hypothetical protein